MVGQIGRLLPTRTKGYHNNSEHNPKIHEIIEKHQVETGCQLDWEQVLVLYYEPNKFIRLVAKMFFIKMAKRLKIPLPEQPNAHLDHSVVFKIFISILFHGSKSVEVKRIFTEFNIR